MPRAMIVAAYMVAGSVVLILLGMLAAVGFDKGMRSRDFIVFEILVALIMLAILAAFWIGALHSWRSARTDADITRPSR